MRPIKTSLAFLMLTIALLASVSCKKESTQQTPANQVQMTGKWKFQSMVVNDFYSGASHVTTYPGNPTDYFDFRTDGKVYYYIFGIEDSTVYGKIGDSKMWMGNPPDTSDIKLLTASALQLYQKNVYAPADYSESTLYFTK